MNEMISDYALDLGLWALEVEYEMGNSVTTIPALIPLGLGIVGSK